MKGAPAGDLTDIAGLRVGHAGDPDARTGCTVVLAEAGAVAGCDVRGSAPGTRETDLLAPGRLVDRVHAILLAGGSAFGLDAAGGVMRYLEERGSGFPVGALRVPIVPAAVIFDLGCGRGDIRPDAAMGYAACLDARRPGALSRGSVGAGLGATVGKALGMAGAMRGGVGSHSLRLDSGVTVAALMVVNAFGSVHDPDTGEWLAGTRNPLTGGPLDMERWLLTDRARGNFAGVAAPGHASGSAQEGVPQDSGESPQRRERNGLAGARSPGRAGRPGGDGGRGVGASAGAGGRRGGSHRTGPGRADDSRAGEGGSAEGQPPAGDSEVWGAGGHTTIGVVATDALLDKAQCHALARMASTGLARSIFPVHTMGDGDALFALSLGTGPRGASGGRRAGPPAAGTPASATELSILGAVAALVVARAVADAVRSAEGFEGVPAWCDLRPRSG